MNWESLYATTLYLLPDSTYPPIAALLPFTLLHILPHRIGRPPLFKNAGGILHGRTQTGGHLLPSAFDTVSVILVDIKASVYLCFDVCEQLSALTTT